MASVLSPASSRALAHFPILVSPLYETRRRARQRRRGVVDYAMPAFFVFFPLSWSPVDFLPRDKTTNTSMAIQ